MKANVLSFTEAQMTQLVNVWLPLYSAGVVDLKYILGKIPDADSEEIMKSQEESALKMLEGIKQQEKTEDEN